jgi:peptidylprolyl isomerase
MTFPPEGFLPLDETNKVFKKIESPGALTSIKPGSTVKVHYKGSLFSDGTVFDSSIERGEPIEFKLGKGMVIKGWDVGIASMRVGEKASLLIDPEYGYGKQGSPPKIPQDAILLFDVELVSVDESTADLSIDEKIAKASEYKFHGNESFKSQNYKESISNYSSGIRILNETFGCDPNQGEMVKDLKISLNSNLAASFLKSNDASAALKHCENVIEIQPDHSKAIYRKFQAQLQLGEYEAAIEFLKENHKVLSF